MKELIFQIELLSDIVLPSSSNTQGNISQLDFIPGSNFLGMVASRYSSFEDSFNVFHSGLVRFMDAHILYKGKQSYKIPLSYFYEKTGNENDIFNHHKIKDFREFEQLKQKRNGYITKDNEIIQIDYNYSQKSSYDKNTRKSEDGGMYGYRAIRGGSKWLFSIKYDDSISKNDIELLEKTLLNSTRLGKAKSSEYGLVKITKIDKKENIENSNSKDLIIYANSRLALVDEFGNPTYDLKYLFDNLQTKNIDYAKCQIRTSTFTPYNGARATKDYQRACINKGSVIVLKDFDLQDNQKNIGAYLSEGFGDILVNPDFLLNDKIILNNTNAITKTINKEEISTNLAKFLQKRESEKIETLNVLDKVDEFIKNHKSLYINIKNSQWGKIRSVCISNDDYKNEIIDYISDGVKQWDEKQQQILKELLDNENLNFIKLVSIIMPKENSND